MSVHLDRPELYCAEPSCCALECEHSRWLAIDDGCYMQQCSPECDIQIVRPGKTQCNCDQ